MNTAPLETLPAPDQYSPGISPAPSKARFWDKLAPRYARTPIADMAGYERSLERTRQYLQREHRVLEIGCGTGTTALHLASQVASYLGTDVSGHMVAIARSKQAQHPCATLLFETADADAPLGAPGTYDVVLAFNVLHLVGDLDATLATCVSALRPGGVLISKTPCLAEMNPLIAWLALPLARLVGKAPPVHCLDQDTLCAAIQRHGLVIDVIERHAGSGRDARPFIVARKPTL